MEGVPQEGPRGREGKDLGGAERENGWPQVGSRKELGRDGEGLEVVEKEKGMTQEGVGRG